jgi:hypothetical protein
MKQTAVEWYNLKVIELMTQREQENIDVLEFRNQLDLLLIQAKEMEKQESYSYDEIRTIAYNAYCLAQLDEPTEGKYNLWIQQYKKK